MDIENEIPGMTDELSFYWDQPDREKILVDKKCALMTKETLDDLKEYNCSLPSGVYVGKMWKRSNLNGWVLCVYNRIIGDEMEIKYRTIILI